jgi:LuxR family maltose regulon positive regulatory protein
VLPGWLRDLVSQEQVAVELMAGRPEASLSVAEDLPDPRSHRAAVLLARAGLALGDQTAATMLDPATIERGDGVPVDVQVDAWLVKAQARLVAADRDQAVTALRRGVRLARPESLRRPFRDAARDVRRMLRTEGSLAPAATWLRSPGPPAPPKLLPVALDGDGTTAPIIVDALSGRETEVLRHLADLLTTEEVAATMFVSVNTVKSHIRSILRKLSVSRRNEAIRRARELQLI